MPIDHDSNRRRFTKIAGLSTAAIATGLPTGLVLAAPSKAPEFTHTKEHEWLNSKPLTLANDLKGEVVMIDFWSFGCWNCYRSFPWMTAMETRLQDEAFTVVGVHTPEFEHEKLVASVAAKCEEFNLKHPVMIDNDFSYWRAMNNRYWPSYYLIDKKGYVRANFIGETHEGDRQAKKIERTINDLLAEPA